jgi:hypothetical protein
MVVSEGLPQRAAGTHLPAAAYRAAVARGAPGERWRFDEGTLRALLDRLRVGGEGEAVAGGRSSAFEAVLRDPEGRGSPRPGREERAQQGAEAAEAAVSGVQAHLPQLVRMPSGAGDLGLGDVHEVLSHLPRRRHG